MPPLQSGDRLSRDEFERRYAAHPDITAELIEGIVYVASPLYPRHGEPHMLASTWLGYYWAQTPGIRVFDNASLRLDANNEPQPDLAVYPDPERSIPDDTFVEAAPRLVVEIAASSASYDLHDKKEAYQRNGVQEYLVFLVHERETRWFRLAGDLYVQMEPGEDGIVRSQACRVFGWTSHASGQEIRRVYWRRNRGWRWRRMPHSWHSGSGDIFSH